MLTGLSPLAMAVVGGGRAATAITFGVSSGNDTSLGGAADQEHLYRLELTQAMLVQGLLAKRHTAPASSAGSFRLTLRADNANTPGTKLFETATTAENSVAAGSTYDLDVTAPGIIAAGFYWLGCHMGTEGIDLAMKTTGGLKRGRCADTFSDGTSTAPGTYTDLSSLAAILIWARGAST